MRLDRFLDLAGPSVHALTRRNAERRRALFSDPPAPGRVVFLGDSITAGGLWDELFPDLPTLNRGIGGDTTFDVLARLDGAINQPRAVSLLIGTNDLHAHRRFRDIHGISERTEELIGRIRARAPGVPVLLNSVTPRTTFHTERISRLNDLNRGVGSRTGATYVDLWPVLADAVGELRSELTLDHLHLTAPGYRAWAEVLRPHLG